MTTDEALEVAATAKEVFPFTTDMQAVAISDISERIPQWPLRDEFDVGPAFFASNVIRRMAESEERLSIPKFKSAMDVELRRRGMTTADEQKIEDRRKESFVLASWQKIDAFIADCSDADLSDIKPQALMLLTNAKAREMFKDKSVRDSKTLRWLVYRVMNERGAA